MCPADQDFSGVVIAVPAQPTQHKSHGAPPNFSKEFLPQAAKLQVGYNISKSCHLELDLWVSEYQRHNQVFKMFQVYTVSGA